MKKISLSPSARSIVEVDIVEGYDPDVDADGRALIAAAYADGALIIPSASEDREALYVALTDLANDCDAVAEDGDRESPDRALHRAARTSITTAATKVLRGKQ